MRSIVEIIQLHDRSWFLRILIIDTTGETVVNTLLTYERYLEAAETAQLLKLHVDKRRSIYGELDQAV